jgi:hypothetical protein
VTVSSLCVFGVWVVGSLLLVVLLHWIMTGLNRLGKGEDEGDGNDDAEA